MANSRHSAREYEAHIIAPADACGPKNARREGRRIVALETQIAERHWPIADRRDRDRPTIRRRAPKLDALAPPSRGTLRSKRPASATCRKFVVAELSAMAPLAKLFVRTPVSTLEVLPHLPLGCEQRAVSCRRTSTTKASPSTARRSHGQPQQRERWKRAVQVVERRARRSHRPNSTCNATSRQKPKRKCASWSRTCARAYGQRIRRAELDVGRDQGRGARKARNLPSEDRLSGSMARLFGPRSPRRRRVRQRSARAASSTGTSISPRRPAGRPTRPNGS